MCVCVYVQIALLPVPRQNVRRQNVRGQNVLRDKTSMGTKRPWVQNVRGQDFRLGHIYRGLAGQYFLLRRYVSGCFVSRRFVSGRFVSGPFVSVRFVWAPCCLMLRTMVQIHWEWFSYILQHYCMNVGIS